MARMPGDPTTAHEAKSRRWFLRAAAISAGSLFVAGCSRGEAEAVSAADATAPEPDPIPRPPVAEPIVRVRVRAVVPSNPPIEIGPNEEWLRVVALQEERTLAVLRGPLQLSRRDGAWSLVDGRGFTPWITDAEAIGISPLRDAAPVLHVDGKAYPGTLHLHARTDRHADAFDVVTHAALEAYLPGVLVRELYNHWHQETHTAQAIAARSFAICEAAFWQKRRHFDLTNSESSQMYEGLTTHEKSLQAVRSTRGVVLAYRDQLVPGYYSASCGGLAATALDAINDTFVNDVPPLMGHGGEDVCTSLEKHRWDVTHSIGTLVGRIAAFGKAYEHRSLAGVEHIEGIELSRVNEHGRPTHFHINTGAGQIIEIAAERLRWAANFTEEPLTLKEQLLSSFVEPRSDSARMTFHGRGHGHGAGMCQHGAEIMAKNGTSALEILKWYYPGVEIVGSYG